jgi:hypothetical protein
LHMTVFAIVVALSLLVGFFIDEMRKR